MSIPDNYDMWVQHEAEKERLLELLPVCENRRCKKRIQDDYYFVIEGELLCEECAHERYRYRTEDYTG